MDEVARALEELRLELEALWLSVWGEKYGEIREAAHIMRLLQTPGDRWKPGDQERVERWYAAHPTDRRKACGDA